MAFAGLHVSCHRYGGQGFRGNHLPLLSKPIWSEAPATGTATTNVAPAITEEGGQVVFRVTAAADSYVAIGPTDPDETAAGLRVFIKANTPTDYIVSANDKLAWVAA